MDVNIALPDAAELAARLRTVPGAAQTALARSINDALDMGRTVSSKAVTERYNVLKRDITEHMRLYKANPGNLLGFIRVRSKKIPLIYFRARDIKPGGVQFTELVRKQSVLPQAFIRTMPGRSYQGVFSRIGATRLPIQEMTGLSIPEMIGKSEVLEPTSAAMNEELAGRLEHYVSLFLAWKSTKAPPK